MTIYDEPIHILLIKIILGAIVTGINYKIIKIIINF